MSLANNRTIQPPTVLPDSPAPPTDGTPQSVELGADLTDIEQQRRADEGRKRTEELARLRRIQQHD